MTDCLIIAAARRLRQKSNGTEREGTRPAAFRWKECGHLTGSMDPGPALPGDSTERARGEAIAAFLRRVLALPPARWRA